MIVFKCKMCGGTLQFEPTDTIGVCNSCGTKQTLPTLDDDRKTKLFERANKLRFNCEFDRACKAYEGLVNDFPDDPESFWGLILCKYGIEYVDDPLTGRKVPTCHRSSYDSIMEDPDFEMVMENSVGETRSLYREEAKKIEELRQGINAVSELEEPYDIFICYKETDDTGQRTMDSVLAEDLYDVLSEEYRVFFSRISLEDKLGSEYEPYIFSALNSSRIMLVVGTSYENYNAVWVRNEWSRFLKLMSTDRSKILIPCFKDIDAYDIPNEFKKFQAQDLGKVGAHKDLLRGIEKILGAPKKSDRNMNVESLESLLRDQSMKSNVTLLKRGFIAIEDKDFEAAYELFEDALNNDENQPDAYLGKLLANYRCESVKHFASYVAGQCFPSVKTRFPLTFHTDNVLRRSFAYYEDLDPLTKMIIASMCRIQPSCYMSMRDISPDKDYYKEFLISSSAPLVVRRYYEHFLELADQKTLDNFQLKQELSRAISEKKAAADVEASTMQTKCSEAYLENLLRQISEDILQKNLNLHKQYEIAKQDLSTRIRQISNEKNAVRGSRKKELAKIEANLVYQKSALREPEYSEQEMRQGKCDSRFNVAGLLLAQLRIDGFVLAFPDVRTVPFGSLAQDGEEKQPINWIVLSRSENRLILLAERVLQTLEYEYTKVPGSPWHLSAVRKFLNETFRDAVFTQAEKNRLCSITSTQSFTYYDGRVQNYEAEDEVFLLTPEELLAFNESVPIMRAEFTERMKKLLKDKDRVWWAKSKGDQKHHISVVDQNGHLLSGGLRSTKRAGIRPAIIVDITC